MDLNALLIKRLSGLQILKTPEIVEAFARIDRSKFIKPEYSARAYEDKSFPIESGQVISQPAAMATMLELLQPKKGEKILDIGAGSGWSTALLAYIVGFTGKVIGTEIMPQLLEVSSRNLLSAEIRNARIVPATKDLGFPAQGPYDRILSTAYMTHIPFELLDQVYDGGTIVLPVKNDIVKIVKADQNNLQITSHLGYQFTPMIENFQGKKIKVIESA